jgi:hypothetical protein
VADRSNLENIVVRAASGTDGLDNKLLPDQGIHILLGEGHDFWLARQHNGTQADCHTHAHGGYSRVDTGMGYETEVVAVPALHTEHAAVLETGVHVVLVASCSN